MRDLAPALSPPGPRPSRVELLLELLRRLASNGLVCATSGELAKWLGMSPDTIRRAIADLIREGRLERTGLRRGRAIQYRLVETPQAKVETPQANAAQIAAIPSAAARPLEGGAAAGSEGRSSNALVDDERPQQPRSFRGSPAEPEDRAWLDGFEWTPELLVEYERRARAFYGRLVDGVLPPDRELLGSGDCDDCGRESRRRTRFGCFKLCSPCAIRRQAVAAKLAGQVAASGAGRRVDVDRPREAAA